MNSNFPPVEACRRRVRQGWSNLPPALRQRLPLALATAALLEAPWLLVAARQPLARPHPPSPWRGDDGPQLLRLGQRLQALDRSRTPLAATSLSLAGLDPLPPPPPDLLPSHRPDPHPVRPRPAAAAVVGRPAAPDSALPTRPPELLALSLAWLPGGSMGAELFSSAGLAVRRHQLLLAPDLRPLLQALEEPSKLVPSPWSGLPDGAEVFAIEPPAQGSLLQAVGSGTSLLDRQNLRLIWRQGQQVWLIRVPLAGADPKPSDAPVKP